MEAREEQSRILHPWARVLVPPLGVYVSLSSSAELTPQQVKGVNYMMKHSSFQKGGPPEPVLGTLNTSFEECKLAPTLILICGTIFHPQTVRPAPILSQRKTQHYLL